MISPCRDEEQTLERTIACVEAQTLKPTRWIVVDDGSKDRTLEILQNAAKRLPFMRVIHRDDRGFRQLGGGVIDAFNAGLATIDVDYDYIAKVDVDLEFPPTYLERIMTYFDADPNLAAASGKVFRQEGDRRVEEFMIDEMVAGQFKLYRRHCFEEIGRFVAATMWDGIDFHKARMAGFRTASIYDADMEITHLRLMGSSDGNVYRGRLRWGRGQWFMGSAFPYILASGLFRAKEKPYVVGGALIIAGYLMGALQGTPRYDDLKFRKGLRKWQYDRLVGLVRGRGVR